MKQSLNLNFSQQLALTPQLQQAIRLLQLSTVELNEEIEVLLQSNPLLERADFSADAASSSSQSVNTTTSNAGLDNAPAEAPAPADDEITTHYESEMDFDGDYGANNSRWEDSAVDDPDYQPQETANITLREHLFAQISCLPLNERDLSLTLMLIDAINDDGYLEQPLEELLALIDDEMEVDLLELETALKHIHHLDPPGVGARHLAECLSLQVKALPDDTDCRELALEVATKHLPLLASRDFIKLKRTLSCDDDALREIQACITKLNPRPGSGFATIGAGHYVQHEINVRKIKGIWVASLNEESIPKLRINQLYAKILKQNRGNSGQYLSSQMQEAKWMIKNIQQRFATILRVSQAIVDRQRSFFEHGEVAMRPMVLREIADELGLHESTISRVTTHKYMMTPRGMYELKYFFGSHVATESGGACSATAIRAIIKQLVAEESPKKPLSDNVIADMLSKQGIMVARRTIAKYRELLNIAPASQRKSL